MFRGRMGQLGNSLESRMGGSPGSPCGFTKTSMVAIVAPAREDDLAEINALARRAGMDDCPGIDDVYVIRDGPRVLAYMQLRMGDDGVCYIKPVNVSKDARRMGLGRKLVEFAISGYDTVRLVSRGYCAGFYDRLGFEELPWDKIDPAIAKDCENCAIRERCSPVPFGISR